MGCCLSNAHFTGIICRMNIGLQRTLLVAAGLALGRILRRPQPTNRFIGDANGNVLDTKTGQICVPVQVKENGSNPPVCLDVYQHYRDFLICL